MGLGGMSVGPAEIKFQLADGQLRAQPLDVAVNEGRFTVAPLVRR